MNKHPWMAGIIGCGRKAGAWEHPRGSGPILTHAQAYHRHSGFRMVAAADPDFANLRQFQQVWNIPQIYRTPEEMQNNEALEVVSVCSPDEWHFSHGVQLLTSRVRPRVVLMEKPVCLTSKELERLTALAKEVGVAVVVNHTRRFDPPHRHVSDLIGSGALGQFVQGRCTYYGGWVHNGTHVIDTIRMLFGKEPQVVSAVVSGCGRLGDQDLDVELLVGDARVTVEAYDESRFQIFDSEFRFQAGRVRLLDFGSTITVEEVYVNELGERVLRPVEDSPIHGLVSPTFEAVKAIDRYLQGERQFHRLGVDLPAASLTMRVIWQAREMATDSTLLQCSATESVGEKPV